MDKRRHIGAPGANARAEFGLTLVELLVVLTILAFAASVVILNAPPSRPPARDAAERFAARMQSVIDAAVIEGASYRLEIGPSEYNFARYKDGKWSPVIGENIASVAGEDVSFRVEIAEAAASNALALNGENSKIQTDEKSFKVLLDPIAGGSAIEAHFESRRGDWTAALSPDGTVSMAQR